VVARLPLAAEPRLCLHGELHGDMGSFPGKERRAGSIEATGPQQGGGGGDGGRWCSDDSGDWRRQQRCPAARGEGGGEVRIRKQGRYARGNDSPNEVDGGAWA
jgi:hypothetical protein